MIQKSKHYVLGILIITLLSIIFVGYRVSTGVEYTMKEVSAENWITDQTQEVEVSDQQLIVRVKTQTPTPCYELDVSHISASDQTLHITTGIENQGGPCAQVISTLSAAIVVETGPFEKEIQTVIVEDRNGSRSSITKEQFHQTGS